MKKKHYKWLDDNEPDKEERRNYHNCEGFHDNAQNFETYFQGGCQED